MSDIFISYAREDLDKARALAGALEENGWSTFWDRTIPIGKSWHEWIANELNDAQCVVVFWSSASVVSGWVIEEADDGKQRGILIPVLIENVLPPLGFRGIQAADLFDWDGRTPTPAFNELITDIGRLIGPPANQIEQEPERAEAEAQRLSDLGTTIRPSEPGASKAMKLKTALDQGWQSYLVDAFLSGRPPVYAKNHDAVKCLHDRLERAWKSDLFRGDKRRETVQPTQIVQEMARIARDSYGLVCRGRTSYWAPALPNESPAGRPPQWLQNLLPPKKPKKSDEETESWVPRNISKLDMLLIGEAFGLPLQSWELTADQNDVFDRHVKHAEEGLNLLTSGFAFFTENSSFFFKRGGRGDDIVIAQQQSRKVVAKSEIITVQQNLPVNFKVLLPTGFGRTQVLLFEQDADGDVTCLSPSRLVDNEPWFEGSEAIVPQSGRTMTLDVPGESVVVAVLALSKEVLLAPTDEARSDELPLLDHAEIEKLKYKLLKLDLETWRIQRQVCRVIAKNEKCTPG